MDTTETLTRWTVRGAFALYVLALALRIRAANRADRRPSADLLPLNLRRRAADPPVLARWLWTGACALLFAHVGFAFHGFHHWSHRAAYAETARQTAELFGIDWGGGLFANYAMLLVWLVDVFGWWHSGPPSLRRPALRTWLAQGFLAFMWFNATVAFGHGSVRWVGLAGFVTLAVCYFLYLRKPDYRSDG